MARLTVHAPELARDLAWLNTPRPLTLRELRGQLVILDFWTYCCVNCMHVIPVLRRLEERHAGDPLVVIGVHSAKFDEEKHVERVMDAIRRYGVTHPVVVDRDMKTWSAFTVRSWPTLVVVRPDGTIAATAPGEPDPAVLEQFVQDELARAKKNGTIAVAPFELHAPDRVSTGPLAYPGKVAIGPDGSIAVSDSAHDRVLVLDRHGCTLHAIGSGLAGLSDGPFATCAFDDPQGLAWKSATELFVADARTHTVRLVDLATRTVRTIAGTGELGEAPLEGEAPASLTALRSPWDVAVAGDLVYVALAGSHQIAVIDPQRDLIAVVAGTGAESIVDGPAEHATFAQPSGLALDGTTLYVADSETSSVRAVDLANRRVRTLVGQGLFDFGDRDGPRDAARMQHCLGVAIGAEGDLVVADTYNHKLRRVDRRSGAVETIHAGDLSEPGGLAWDDARGAWLVADTNRHRLVRARSGELEAIAITGAPEPERGRVARSRSQAPSYDAEWFTKALAAEGGGALGEGDAEIALVARAPSGKKFAAGSAIRVSLEVSRRSDLLVPARAAFDVPVSGEPAQRIAFAARVAALGDGAVEAEVVVRLDAIACAFDANADTALCEPCRAWLRLPVRLAKGGASHVAFVDEA